MLPLAAKYANYESVLSYIQSEAIAWNKFANIPISQINSSDYAHFPGIVRNKLTQYASFYCSILENIGKTSAYSLPEIRIDELEMRKFTDSLPGILGLYYLGDIVKSTISFNSLMNSINLVNLVSQKQINAENFFYRARPMTNYAIADKFREREEMFHVPYNMRYLIKTNRYSIPGLPALYLGGSPYVCWAEFGKPTLETVAFSKFQLQHPIVIMKMQRLEDLLIEIYSLNDKEKVLQLLSYLFILPLMIACSFRAKILDAPFKPEYIIPQLLLQYIKNTGTIDGIMYPSTVIDYELNTQSLNYNYVIPTKLFSVGGYDGQLCDMFKLTPPTYIPSEISEQDISSSMRPLSFEHLECLLAKKDFSRIFNQSRGYLTAQYRHRLNK